MTCEDMELLLAAYVDGVAEPGDRRFVEAHLRECEACREDVARQRAVRRVLAVRGRDAAAHAEREPRGRDHGREPDLGQQGVGAVLVGVLRRRWR